MIVTIDNVDAIVVGYNSNNTWYCVSDGELRLKRIIEPRNIKIKDPRIPNDWVMSNYYYTSWDGIPDWLDADYNDYIFFCCPKSIDPSYLVELSYENVDPNERTPFENYVMLKALNDIRTFHDLPKNEIPYIEAYEIALMSYEERRAKALNDELDEYLRIGEEIEREKDIKS